MYVGDYLARRCVYTPEKTALIQWHHGRRVCFTYRQLDARANRLANWLLGQGIEKGDRVGMLALDGVHFYDLFFACCKIGAIFVPYNWRLHPEELADQLRLTSPKLLFHDLEQPSTQILSELERLTDVPRCVPWPATEEGSLPEEIATTGTPVTCEELTENDTACLLFTGGTTGKPKAAQISHRQIVWNTFNALLADVLGTDTYLNIFPLFHAGGLFAFSVPLLLLGGTVVQVQKFDAAAVLSLMEAEKVTIFAGVPTTFQLLAEAPNWAEADLGTLRYCLSGGAPLPVALVRKYQKEKGVVFRQGFGMTEFGPDVFSLPAADAERKAGSIGKPNFFVDARVVRPEDNTPLPPNEVGELVLRGPTATTGYFQNPEATRAAFDEQNYFHTGDLAYVDEEGYFFIVDRLKDMFISGGENVYPAEVEAVLYQHPAVQMCAVVGVEDEKWGQVGCAFVVLRKGKQVSAQALQAHVKRHLAKYKVPRFFVFRESLPVSGAGKLLKTELLKSVDELEPIA